MCVLRIVTFRFASKYHFSFYNAPTFRFAGLITKTADGYINVIEVKTSGNKWRSKSNMGGWTRKNIEKITVTPMVCGLANPNIKTICLQ